MMQRIEAEICTRGIWMWFVEIEELHFPVFCVSGNSLCYRCSPHKTLAQSSIHTAARVMKITKRRKPVNDMWQSIFNRSNTFLLGCTATVWVSDWVPTQPSNAQATKGKKQQRLATVNRISEQNSIKEINLRWPDKTVLPHYRMDKSRVVWRKVCVRGCVCVDDWLKLCLHLQKSEVEMLSITSFHKTSHNETKQHVDSFTMCATLTVTTITQFI